MTEDKFKIKPVDEVQISANFHGSVSDKGFITRSPELIVKFVVFKLLTDQNNESLSGILSFESSKPK